MSAPFVDYGGFGLPGDSPGGAAPSPSSSSGWIDDALGFLNGPNALRDAIKSVGRSYASDMGARAAAGRNNALPGSILPTSINMRDPTMPASNVQQLQTGYNGSSLFQGSNDYGYPNPVQNGLQTVADAIGVARLSLKAFVRLARTMWAALIAAGLDPALLAALLLRGMAGKSRRRGRGITGRQLSNARKTIRTMQSFNRMLHLGGGHRAPSRPQYAFQKRQKR